MHPKYGAVEVVMAVIGVMWVVHVSAKPKPVPRKEVVLRTLPYSN